LNSELVHNATATLAITADQLQFDERRKSLNTDTITGVQAVSLFTMNVAQYVTPVWTLNSIFDY